MKIIDFDKVFDKKMADIFKNTKGKYTEEEWEDKVPELYQKFGNTYFSEIDDTPINYYKKMDDNQILQTIQAHFQQDVPVSDYLRVTIEERKNVLLSLLKSENQQAVLFAVRELGQQTEYSLQYLELLKNAEKELKELLTEYLIEDADTIKEELILLYQKDPSKKEYLEIMSFVQEKDDRIFDFLKDAFVKATKEEVSEIAILFANYKDNRALPILLKKIEGDVDYLQYRDIKYSIEALGGEYTIKRDFSSDEKYKQLQDAILREEQESAEKNN